jgi:CRISPR/Cas system-associated exonuclease Cas4 (RecB family)
MPKPNTERELSFYSVGQGHHSILEGLHNADREVEHVWEGIQGHLDLLDHETPVEIKTTRSFRHDINCHWIIQLAFYCAMRGVNRGKLIVLYLFPERATKKKPNPSADMIETFNIDFPDIERIRQELLRRRDLLTKALEANNPTLAPTVRNDPESNWLCRNCAYRVECDTQQ